MLTRREFNKTLTGLVFATMAAGPMRAANDTSAGLGDAEFLNRLTYGATPESIAELAGLGRQKWLEQQLDKPALDAGLQDRFSHVKLWIEYEAGENEDGKAWPAVAEGRALNWLNAKPDELVKLLDWEEPLDFSERDRPAVEVIAASLIRAVHAPAQLREVMTQFWHDHFSVNAMKDEVTAALFPVYDRVLREHAFGNFRTMLGAVAKSPPMLHYLNNDESYASPANENYARELLELHTLGQGAYYNDIYDNWREVPGAEAGNSSGFIDADVYEVARALTGWSIADGREINGNSFTENNGGFAYIQAWHDPYQKRVLGHELPAFSGPTVDGETVLDILAAHPGTARFVTEKMLRRLGIETPSKEYHDAVINVFAQNYLADDQIALTLRAIIEHPEFAATPPTKLRRPFEYVAALYRVTGAEISPTDLGMDWRLSGAGWTQHQVRPPTGHSDKTEDWADTRTINGMISLARDAHDDWNETTENILAKVPGGAKNIGEMAAYWAVRFSQPVSVFETTFLALEADKQDAVPTDKWDIEWINQIIVTSAALAPEFVFR